MGLTLAVGQRSGSGIARLLQPGVEFDAAMSKVQALSRLDKDSKELAMLRQQAKELGATTMFQCHRGGAGPGLLAMAGFSPEAIRAAMPGMLDMAKAGDMDLGRTADISSNILSAFGIDPTNMGQVNMSTLRPPSPALHPTDARPHAEGQVLGDRDGPARVELDGGELQPGLVELVPPD